MTDTAGSAAGGTFDFSALDSVPDSWAPSTEADRRERRSTASMKELQEFYTLTGPLVAAIAEYLAKFPITAPLPPYEQRLFRLAQMYMEAAWAVEVIKRPEEANQVSRERWRITPLLHTATRKVC
jgi:hypothetical protein